MGRLKIRVTTWCKAVYLWRLTSVSISLHIVIAFAGETSCPGCGMPLQTDPVSTESKTLAAKPLSLGSRMKRYEFAYRMKVPNDRPVLIRLDGRSFSNFTRGMNKPFDHSFRQAMINTAKHLVKKTHARIAYTGSDEITLLFYNETTESCLMFGGRVQKLASVFAAMASVYFYSEALSRWPEKVANGAAFPVFDARFFSVPSKMEAFNAILWRQQDTIRNSIQMVAGTLFSSKQRHKLNSRDLITKLMAKKNIDWHQFSENEKRGTFVKRVLKERCLTEEELKSIPEPYWPTEVVTRSEIETLEVPPLITIENKEEFFFDNDAPRMKTIR